MVVVINKPASNNTPLALSSPAVNGATLTITFDRGLATDAGSVAVAVSCSKVTLTLATDEAVNAGETAFLTYGEVTAVANFARCVRL